MTILGYHAVLSVVDLMQGPDQSDSYFLDDAVPSTTKSSKPKDLKVDLGIISQWLYG
jgi:hypothetical protein